MDLTTLDIMYYSFIGLVLIGGIAAIIILCPKENKLRQEKENCYRFIFRDGKLTQTGKASLFENWGKKPVYIEKGPFEINCFIDGAEAETGKKYNAGVMTLLYLPENAAQSSADYLYSIMEDINQDAINTLLTEEINTTLTEFLKKYDGNLTDKLKETFRDSIISRLQRYGYDLYCPPTLKITEV